MTATGPDQVVQQFLAAIHVLIRVKRGTAGQRVSISRGESRDFGMGTIPVQMVVGDADAGLVGKVGPDQAEIASPTASVF